MCKTKLLYISRVIYLEHRDLKPLVAQSSIGASRISHRWLRKGEACFSDPEKTANNIQWRIALCEKLVYLFNGCFEIPLANLC